MRTAAGPMLLLLAGLAMAMAPLAAADPVGAPGAVLPSPDLRLLPGNPGGSSPIDPPRTQPEPRDPPGDFADRVGDTLQGRWAVASVAGLLVVALGLGALAMVSRYVTPKEALANPQRSMLYGYVRGHPGVHLKQLSDEFKLKTSSILWHMRKLECAELVRTERANGFRVFYPTAGGMEVKVLSRGVAAIQNANALAIYDAIERTPATTVAALVDRLGLHGGTIRWHLRKLVEYGLVEDAPSGLFATPVGRRAAEALRAGRPSSPAPVPAAAALTD